MQLPGILMMSVLAFCALASGCATKTSDRDLAFVATAEAEQLVKGRSGLFGLGNTHGVWVDPRTEAEYLAGHIPGAIHLPLERARADHRRLRGYGVLIVYGNDYNSSVALAMSKTLLELGYENVRTLRGGLREWQAAGNAVEEGEGG